MPEGENGDKADTQVFVLDDRKNQLYHSLTQELQEERQIWEEG